MIIKLIIATTDRDYSEYLSNALSERYAKTFAVSVCSSEERLAEMLGVAKYDVALLEAKLASGTNLGAVSLPLVLVDESGVQDDSSLKKIRKYQRISLIAGEILENYAHIGKSVGSFGAGNAQVTAIWSPAGGSGKTAVSLAYAANKALGGKQAAYLSLENFSSTSVYFQDSGKSISKAFEKLDSNIQMFLKGIRQQDSGTGVLYFNSPENYDDMNILTESDIETLISACAEGIDELVVDLPSQCDLRTQKVFEMADKVLLVCDLGSTSQAKLGQFISQHNVFEKIQSKAVLVNNKGAQLSIDAIGKSVRLPQVKAADPVSIFRALSGANFE